MFIVPYPVEPLRVLLYPAAVHSCCSKDKLKHNVNVKDMRRFDKCFEQDFRRKSKDGLVKHRIKPSWVFNGIRGA